LSQILYKPISAATQVAVSECFLDGVVLSLENEFMVYDEADSSRSASKLVCLMHASSYYRFESIMFPPPGVRMNSGIYAYWNEKGSNFVYYHYGKASEADILYSSILSATDKLVSAAPCYLVGAEISSGTMAIYDEADATHSAGSLVTTLKMGSYKSYNRIMFANPIKCSNGIYVDNQSAIGTIYYSLKLK
jgi:hypothetical protein